MKMLSPQDVTFERSPNGVMSCRMPDGKTHPRIHCVALFPLSLPGKFISIFEERDQEIEEIGIIGDLDEFDEAPRSIISEAVRERYFVPEILDLKQISLQQGRRGAGFCELAIATDRGPKVIHIFNPRENICVNSSGVVMISDIERNRYKISDPDKLPAKARRALDMIML